MPVSFPNPVLSQSHPVIPGIDLNPVLKTFLDSHRLQLEKAALEAQREELAFRRSKFEAEHALNLERAKTETAATKLGITTDQLEALERTNPEAVEKGGPMGMINTGEGEEWLPHPGYAQGEHPDVTIGAPEIGVPNVTVKPRTFDDILSQEVRKKYLEESAGAQGKREGNMITVDPAIHSAYPYLELGSQISPEFAQKLPGIENVIQLPEEMGGRMLPKSEADLEKAVYEQQQQNYRAHLADERIRSRRSLYLQQSLFTDAEVEKLANQIATGQAPLEALPSRGEVRARVMLNLANRGVAIPRKGLIDKMDNFATVQSLSDKLRASYMTYMDAVDSGDPMLMARSMDQFKREVMGFSSFTARDFGEKGVLTDADRRVFSKLLGYDTPVLLAEAIARGVFDAEVEDMWSINRLDELQDTVDSIYSRTFGEYEQRVKSKLMLGNSAQNTTINNTPTVQTEIPRVSNKEGILGLKAGVVFEVNGKKYRKVGGTGEDGFVEVRDY